MLDSLTETFLCDEILSRFEEHARQLIDQGADVIISGDTVKA